MAASNMIAMYFKVEARTLKHTETWQKLEDIGWMSLGKIQGECTSVSVGGEFDRLLVFPGHNGSHTAMRVYSHGLVTVDLYLYTTDHYDSFEQHPYNMAVSRELNAGQDAIYVKFIRSLEARMKAHLGDLCTENNSLYAPIRRGQPAWPYAVSADERILEMDYDKLVFEKNSDFQNIRIFHSKEFGNVLLLDGDSMLGESDLIYTRTICCLDQDDYKDKEVLILGGGDGGILHELLKENPKFITMAEIDEEVIKGCRRHMRSVCGSSMDKLEGPNYKIVLDDCVKVLHESIQSGHLYDYVINDLTEFPVEKAVRGYGYDVETTSLITELSLKAIKPGGKVLARGNCWGAYEYRERFENDLRAVDCSFKRRDVFVPSFQETYCLYEIWKNADADKVIRHESNGAAQNGHV